MLCRPFNSVAECFKNRKCRVTISQYGVMHAIEHMCWTVKDSMLSLKYVYYRFGNQRLGAIAVMGSFLIIFL